MKKVLSLLAVLALALVAIPAAMAVTFDDNETVVKINGHEVDDTTVLDVERGETLDLDLAVTARDESIDDVRWVVWIGGYEDLIEVSSEEPFDLEQDVTSLQSLSIEIPADLDVDEDGTYTLHIELRNSDVEYEVYDGELNIEVSKTRHLLIVDDVIAPATVEAGEDVAVKVRVENMGSYEEDAKVTVGVPTLGVSASDFLDDLERMDTDDRDSDDSTGTVTLVLEVPEDAAAGDHELVVDVLYHKVGGEYRKQATETVTLTVAGEAAPAEEPVTVEGVITVDATTKSLAQGEEKVYKLAFANLGKEAQLYTVRAVGTQLWADVRVEPSLVAVPAGEVAEAFVYLTAHEDAELGNHIFTLQVNSGNDLVKEVALGAKVTEKTAEPAPAASLLQGNSTLKLAFVGLVVLLVIVGLFIAFRKLKEDEDYPLEPKDGQTYY